MAGCIFNMRSALFAVVLVAFVICALSIVPAHAACGPVTSETVEISAIAPDGTLTLKDGRALRLVTLEPPVHSQALAQWTKIISDKARGPVALHPAAKSKDRYGRLQGLVRLRAGGLLEAQLVSAGWARVHPRADMRDCVSALLALEDEARAGGRGLWRLPEYSLIGANNMDALYAREGTFVLAEGVVRDAVYRGGRLYLNFGADWKTDFTVTVAPADVKLFTDMRFSAKPGERLKVIGERVRVRGFLTRYNGPELILTCPEQLEFLGQGPVEE
ncbi:MAG: thermonuclease family protein [Parvibaculum sp.]|nr:thermonuclease family protein [Parvibaculum sp.]